MELLIGILVIILILIVLILGIILYLVRKVKRTVGVEGMSLIRDALKNNTNYDKENYSNEKSISGMTNIYEPIIRKDFPDFNLELFFNNVNKNINSYLECLENQDIRTLNKSMILIKGTLKKKIQDMKDNNISECFKDIDIHRTAIKSYYKKNGTATIVTNSSIGYYYKTNDNSKKQYEDIKKETKYVCEFVYVYDEDKFDEHAKTFGLHCPNCGAPINKLGDLECSYCGSYVKEINLKNWSMANIKEIDTL